MAQEAPTAAINELAQKLGWQGTPQGADAEALGLLLDDEFDRLTRVPRTSFAERVRMTCPDQVGGEIIICKSCLSCCLGRFQPDDGHCRSCGESLELWGEDGDGKDSGFGFVLGQYGAGQPASVLNPAAGPDVALAWDLAADRRLSQAFKLDADNKDWDDLLDDIAARRAEAERKRREEEERKQREAEERKRKAEEARREAERQKELERKRKEAERKRKEEEERKRKEEEERKRQAELERKRREAERFRPALGCVVGKKPGEIVRIDDQPQGGPGSQSMVWIEGPVEAAVAFLHVGDDPVLLEQKPVAKGKHKLELGQMVQLADEIFVVEETGELGGQVAEQIHFARKDDKPGGPWPYWNEDVNIGAVGDCAIQVVDDGVANVHAQVSTRFGVVVLEDRSGQGSDDGLFVDGKRQPWVLAWPDVVFKLGPKGPELKVGKGQAKVKAGKKAKAMKPARHKRTVIEIRNAKGQLVRKVFVFARREVRFGCRSHSSEDETRMINELTLVPSSREDADIAEKQGALSLSRDGVEIRRDGGAEMFLTNEPLVPGKPQALTRRFTIQVGENMFFDGRVYRSPTAVARDRGPARLGTQGGHPFECVRLDRKKTPHTYVFMVRMLRIGSEPFAPLRLTLPDIKPSHCQILFSQGKFLIVAPKPNAPVLLGDVEMDPGVAFPLEIDTVIKVGSANLIFRVVDDGDFLLS